MAWYRTWYKRGLSIFAISFLMTNMWSCGSPEGDQRQASDYELEYLTLTPYELPNTLTARALKSAFSIHTEGTHRSLQSSHIVQAVQAWFNPVRKYSSRIASAVNVNQGGQADVVIRYSNSNGRAYAMVGRVPVTIQLYADDGYEVLLHELGHAVGLGDTYLEYGGCKPGQPDSVMCTGRTNQLMRDDIQGVEELFCRLHPTECRGNTGGGGVAAGGGSVVNPPPIQTVSGGSCPIIGGTQTAPATCSTVRIVGLGGDPLNIRSLPGLNQQKVGSMREGSTAQSKCRYAGPANSSYLVNDPASGRPASSEWIYIQGGGLEGWISSVYAQCQ